jgi:hypothetical protein
MENKLGKLSINPDTTKERKTRPDKKSKEAVMESWDDDTASSSSDTEVHQVMPSQSASVPNAPPPTPISPNSAYPSWDFQDQIKSSNRTLDRDSENQRRPEKSAAAAERLIAAGLGMRAPKKTEEQRAYDRAARENELKRRSKEKEAKFKELEESKKAQAVMWDS